MSKSPQASENPTISTIESSNLNSSQRQYSNPKNGSFELQSDHNKTLKPTNEHYIQAPRPYGHHSAIDIRNGNGQFLDSHHYQGTWPRQPLRINNFHYRTKPPI